MGFDILKYAALLAKVFQLEEKLRKDPPSDVESYTAAVIEVKDLWNEIHAMLQAGNVTPGDIEAAHLRNQQEWNADADPNQDDIAYTTKEEAIAALHGDYVLVLEMADGSFRIWPMVGPLPGKQVWPE